jgi:class 3 adenylate cyclase/tetratricopeptide (TPR) repeat protein
MESESQARAPGLVFEDRYEILAKLGEGGFGSVFKARQVTTGQLVALKVMRDPEHRDAARMGIRAARFLREARLCAKLHHPHIVQVLDSGHAADGGLYTVFAFAPGDNLATVLAREGSIAPVEAQRLMLQVLDALACAHGQGVVHRDLKPSNVMIIPTGAKRNALVLDFGIGGIVHGSGDDIPTRLTGSEDTLGTPGYSAPEQSRGVEPSPRADLFSWALLFLECLVGRPVYRGSSAAEIFYQVLGPDPVPMPPLLQRHPLGAILTPALQKDVAARTVTARELHEALEACDLSSLSSVTLPEGAGAGLRRPSAETSQTARPERRQVTALCCALDVTALPPGAIELEEADEILQRAMALCAEIGLRHEGLMATALGQTLLVYFGYPHAEEDDAQRAGRAAIAMARAIEGLSRELDWRGARVDVRIGLHTDFVVAAQIPGLGGASPLAGVTPRIALDAAAAARSGCVLVTAASRALLHGSFEIEEASACSFSGGTRQVTAFRLGDELDIRAASRGSDESRLPLIGRDREVELLLERWRLATDEALFLEGRCSPDARHSPLFPIVELLERTLGLDQDADTSGKTTRLEQKLADYGLALEQAMPVFLPLFSLPVGVPYSPLDVSPPRQKALTLDAIVSLLLAIAAKRSVLLLVEDLHWADSATVEVLARIVQEGSSVPICVLMTARSEFAPSFSTTAMLQIPLNRLDRAQVEAMVADLAGQRPFAAKAVEQVASRTDGVPLFVEELTRMMLESDGAVHDAEIPSTLRALLTVRLDRLGRAKETAQIAAALGREFGIDLLSAVSPLGVRGVREDLDRLTSAGMVLRKRHMRDPVGTFKHALVRDAAYESLPRATRQQVHARIAQVLEERFPEIVAGRPDLLAHHHAAADAKPLAIPYAIRAAHHALKRSAYAEAIAHASSVIACAEGLSSAERIEAELAANGLLTQATMATRGWADDKVKSTVDRSTELLEKLDPESKHRVPTLWFLFTYHHVACNRRAARTVAREVNEIAERRGDRSLAVAAAALLGVATHADGDHLAAREALERAVRLHDPASDLDHGPRFGLDSLVLAKTLLGHHQWHRGEDEEAFRLVADALDWARETRHVPSIAIGLLYGCQVHQFAGDKATVAAMTGEILGLAAKYGLPAYEGYAATMHDWAVGDGERAQEIIRRLARTGSKASLSYFGSLAAERLAERGRLDVAIESIESCLRLCTENEEHLYEPELHRRLGTYLMQHVPPRTEQARAAFEQAADRARRYDMPRTEVAARCELIDRFHSGDEDRARVRDLITLHPGLGRSERSKTPGASKWTCPTS